MTNDSTPDLQVRVGSKSAGSFPPSCTGVLTGPSATSLDSSHLDGLAPLHSSRLLLLHDGVDMGATPQAADVPLPHSSPV